MVATRVVLAATSAQTWARGELYAAAKRETNGEGCGCGSSTALWTTGGFEQVRFTPYDILGFFGLPVFSGKNCTCSKGWPKKRQNVIRGKTARVQNYRTTQPLTQAHSATSPVLSLTRPSQIDPRHGTGAPREAASCCHLPHCVPGSKSSGCSRRWTNTVGQTFPTWWNKPRHPPSFCLPLQQRPNRRMARILQMCQELG